MHCRSAFLGGNGLRVINAPLDLISRHLDRHIERIGESRIGFVSDFNGALVPEILGDVIGLVTLRDTMRSHGYDEAGIEWLCR